jgi:Flp pilus assembly protein CpaB
MRRYRTVILVFVFGIVPMAAAVVLGVTVILPSFQQTDTAVDTVAAVEPVPPPEPVKVRVAMTATQPLLPGALLTTRDLAVEEVRELDVPLPPEHYVYLDEVEASGESGPRTQGGLLRGYAVQRAVAAGQPVTWDAVVGPDDAQFLATVLAADRVAVSIPVSMANRQAKLVNPGNRVDVLLAVEQEGELVVQTIVEDVRVIAVNSRVIAEKDIDLGDQGRTDGAGDGAPTDAAASAPPEVATVTLEVRPIEGEHLALGAYEGQLSLAIRPLAGALRRPPEPVQNLRSVLRLPEPEPEPLPEPVPATDPVPPPAVPVSVRVVRGTTEETVVFFDDGTIGGSAEQAAAGERDLPTVVRGAPAATPTVSPQ